MVGHPNVSLFDLTAEIKYNRGNWYIICVGNKLPLREQVFTKRQGIKSNTIAALAAYIVSPDLFIFEFGG
jgi:hypothetical protein